jgi:prefoldin subunit 5
LGSTLGTVKERIEQLVAAQQQTANDVAKLQAAEQEIRQKLSTLSARPTAPAAPAKQQTTTTAPRPLTPQH